MKQSIVDASIELFIEQGYEKTTTRQILEKVGILNGSLYNIYRSKDDIFADIVIRALNESIDMMEDFIGTDATFAEKMFYLPCMEIYASSRSPRIAELLAVAIERRDIHEKVASFYVEKLSGMDDESREMMSRPDFGVRLAIYDGSVGSVLRGLAAGVFKEDVETMMLLICSIQSDLFLLPKDSLDECVRRLVDSFDSRDIVICGIRV